MPQADRPATGLPDEVLGALSCPHDDQALTQDTTGLTCPAGHRFDRARQGHLTLTSQPLRHHGDTADQVASRLAVHGAGVLGVVHDAVVAEALVGPLPPGIVTDLGSGPGTYLAAVLEALPERTGLAVDVSKAAARRAARCHPRAGAIVADVWHHVPVRDRAVALGLLIFAPRSGGEPARLLAPGGVLLVVTPGPDHLGELRARTPALGLATGKDADVPAALGPAFELATRRRLTSPQVVSRATATELLAMGPSGHHLGADDLEAIAASLPDRLEVVVDVDLWRFRRSEVGPVSEGPTVPAPPGSGPR